MARWISVREGVVAFILSLKEMAHYYDKLSLCLLVQLFKKFLRIRLVVGYYMWVVVYNLVMKSSNLKY